MFAKLSRRVALATLRLHQLHGICQYETQLDAARDAAALKRGAALKTKAAIHPGLYKEGMPGLTVPAYPNHTVPYGPSRPSELKSLH